MLNLKLELKNIRTRINTDYDPVETASLCLNIYHNFSKFYDSAHDEIMRLIAMDRGEEFYFEKEQALHIIDFLIDQHECF
ncbi:hypothetical protein AY606_05520 [Acinetobacter sp. SFB]|nr:hypothetical protein AY606_05520 [Acinetobacter sp. SFB]